MIEFRIESDPVHLFKDLEYLLEMHKDELCLFPDAVLSPDWDVYTQLHHTGKLIVITLRRNDKIVGYTVNFISRHTHYDFIYGVNDILYILPEYRGYGIKLIKVTERALKDKGVEFFSLSIKPHVDFRRVIEKLGYSLLEFQYFRRI